MPPLTASLPHCLTVPSPHCRSLLLSLPHCPTASCSVTRCLSLPHCLTPSGQEFHTFKLMTNHGLTKSEAESVAHKAMIEGDPRALAEIQGHRMRQRQMNARRRGPIERFL